MRKFLFASLLLLFVVACSSLPNAATLPGTTWEVASIMDADSTIIIQGNEHPSLTFISTSEFGGQTLCNSIQGTYTTQGENKIMFSLEAMSMALCPDNTLEAVFIEHLGLTEFFALTGDTLKLKDGDGRAIIKLSRVRP